MQEKMRMEELASLFISELALMLSTVDAMTIAVAKSQSNKKNKVPNEDVKG